MHEAARQARAGGGHARGALCMMNLACKCRVVLVPLPFYFDMASGMWHVACVGHVHIPISSPCICQGALCQCTLITVRTLDIARLLSLFSLLLRTSGTSTLRCCICICVGYWSVSMADSLATISLNGGLSAGSSDQHLQVQGQVEVQGQESV